MEDEVLDVISKEKPLPESERFQERQGLKYAGMACTITMIVMVIMEYIIFKKPDFGKPVLVFLAYSVMDISDHRLPGKKKCLISGIFYAVIALAFFILYIGSFFI